MSDHRALGLLLAAIVAEVVATSALKASDGLTRPVPAALVLVGYGLALWLFGVSLRTLPVGSASALWSGLGTVGVVLTGLWLFEERVNLRQGAGLALIVAGVCLVQLYADPAAAGGRQGAAALRAADAHTYLRANAVFDELCDAPPARREERLAALRGEPDLVATVRAMLVADDLHEQRAGEGCLPAARPSG